MTPDGISVSFTLSSVNDIVIPFDTKKSHIKSTLIKLFNDSIDDIVDDITKKCVDYIETLPKEYDNKKCSSKNNIKADDFEIKLDKTEIKWAVIKPRVNNKERLKAIEEKYPNVMNLIRIKGYKVRNQFSHGDCYAFFNHNRDNHITFYWPDPACIDNIVASSGSFFYGNEVYTEREFFYEYNDRRVDDDTKIPLRRFLEEYHFEADNDEETTYELSIAKNNDNGPNDMLSVYVHFDHEFPGNDFESVKGNKVRILYSLTTYEKLNEYDDEDDTTVVSNKNNNKDKTETIVNYKAKCHTNTLYTGNSEEAIRFLKTKLG